MTHMTAPDDRPEPPATVADPKDWTVVVRESCAECGFDPARLQRRELPGRIRDTIPRWQAVLTRSGGALHDRPAPTTWSPLEYACHVRDVTHVFTGRLDVMLREDDPSLPSWDQDAAAVEGRYWREDAGQVAEAYAEGAAVLAGAFDSVPDSAWDRPGRRSDGSAFTVETLGAYCLHDLEHHLTDVGATPR
jgi:hypothetical protein